MYNPHHQFLDDFLSAEYRFDKGKSLKITLHVSSLLCILLAINKISGPSATLTFLCITLYTVALEPRLSAEKN